MNVMNCRALRQAQACFCVAFSLRSTSRRGGGSLCRVFRGAAGAVDNWVARQSRGSTLRFSSSSSSSFQAPAPPSTHGNPVFPDIDFSVAASPTAESVRRNNDPSSVFVVTGASRGIGLQFVKSLLDRTKVSVSLPVLVPGFVSLAHTSRLDAECSMRIWSHPPGPRRRLLSFPARRAPPPRMCVVVGASRSRRDNPT